MQNTDNESTNVNIVTKYLPVEPPVYPSDRITVFVKPDENYGGAHRYSFLNSTGFSNGEATYDESFQEIQFVQKNLDSTMTPGVQSEQLVVALLDRCHKLNDKFPSEQSGKMIDGLRMFLEACRQRIDDRISRGVMGDLKK